MQTTNISGRSTLIILLSFFTIISDLNAQYVKNVSWADRVGYVGASSVNFKTQDAAISGDTVFQIGRVKGFSNFISTDTTNGIYLTHGTKQQGYIASYDHINQGLIDYELLESPNDIQMRSIEKIGDYFYVSGTFKDFLYIGLDTLTSPHPNNPYTGFLIKLNSSFQLVDSFIFSYRNNNYGQWWPAFSVAFNNELYVLVYGMDGNPEHLELVKFDSNLNVIWNRKWTNNDWKQPRGLTVDEYGNLYVAGYIESSIDVNPDTAVTNIFSPYNSNQQYGLLVSVDSSGAYRWHYVLDEGNNSQNDFGLNICYYQGNIIAHGFTNGGGTYLDPNSSSSVTSTAEDNILRINSSNGHLTDFISGMGTVLNPGYVRAINFQVVDEYLYILTKNSGSGYIEPGNSNLHNFSESNSIIKYDSSFNAEVIFEFTGHVDNQYDNMTQFQATSDDGFYFVMNEWDYGTEIKYRDNSGQQQTALAFQSLTFGNTISLRMKLLTTCLLTNFDEQNIQSNSAELSWDYNGDNSFNIEYGLKGFIQGTGTGSLAGQTRSNISEPYTLSGLNANTDYDYYIESNCEPGQWYGPFSFRTSIGCNDLFFSEYFEGSSNNKYFELYNPTNDTISLDNYSVYLSVNGDSLTNTFTPSGSIIPGDVYVVATNQSVSVILAEADTSLGYPSVAHFNGDDALILMNSSDTIDVIGTPGIDPGSSWILTDGATTKDQTLVRKKEISSGQLSWTLSSDEWDSYPPNTWSEIGSHTSNCINTGTDIPAYYPLNDLLGFWPLDSNILDYSGNDNHMMESSSHSIGYGSDRYGIPHRARNTGVAFTDIDSLYYLNELTANIWVSISNSSATNTAAFCHSPANWNAGPRWKLWNKDNGDGLSLRSWTQATSWKDVKYGSANLNDWYMLTATFSDGWQKLYVNSVIVDSIQASLDTINVFNSIMIGGTKESSSGTITGIWQGSLDEAGIWGRSLSQSEITDIYLGADTNFLAQVPYINVVESCIGNTVTDIDYPDTSLYDIVWYTSPATLSGDTTLSLLMTDSTEVLWAAYSEDVFGTKIYSKRVKVEFVSLNSSPSFLTIEDCDSIFFEGVTYIRDTMISVNYVNQNNCDSLVTYTFLIGSQKTYNTGLSLNGMSSDSTYFASTLSPNISIGTSPNAYSAAFGARQNLSANQDLNSIVFVHRSDYGSNNDNSSGSLRYDISTDGGLTWSTNQGPVWNPSLSGYAYPGFARYPQMGILNSPGNATPSNASLAVWAPTLVGINGNAWGGALHGNVGIGTSVNNLTVDTTAGHLTLDNSFTQDGQFWGISLDHPNYDVDEYTDTTYVFKGVMDWSSDSMIYSEYKAYMPSTNDPTNGKIYGDANIVFDDLGSTGYISLITYNSQIAPDKVIHPVLSKSLNGGQSWTPVFGPNLDHLVDNVSGDSLKDIFDNITSGWTIGHLTSSTRGHDLALDANGRPHMIIDMFPGKGTNPGTGTLAGDFVFYPGVHLLVDVYLDNGLWKCNVLKQAYTFDYDYDPNNGPVSEANRPQISMSPDREWLFFSWFETDTSFVSGQENQFPDWYVSVYDVNGDSLFNQYTKLAGFGDRHFANVSEWAFDNGDNTYELHSVYSSIDDWGTFSVLSPIDHYYQKATLTIVANQYVPDTLFLCQGDTVELWSKETNAASYLWSTGETSNQISVSTSGLYWVDLLDSSSCSTLSDSVYIKIITNPLDSITSNSLFPICRQDSMMLRAPLGDSYLWSTGDTTQLIEIDSSGTYSVTVTNGDYCSTLSQPFTAIINEYPDAQLTAGSQYLCDTDTLQVSVPSGNSYSWSTSDTTAGISISSAGDYWVTVVDSNLCTSTSDTISIGINALPNDSIVVSGTLDFCDGDFVEFTAYDATANYAWSNGDTTGTIFVDQTGQYSLTLTSDSGCVSTTSSFATLNMPLPDAQLTAGSQYLCDTDTLQVSVPAGNTYNWSTSDTTAGISITSAGDYWVTVVDSNLCTSTSDTISIGINALPNDSIVVSGTLDFCDGDFVEFTAYDATANYAWSNGDTTGTIFVDQTGQYSLTLTSDSGCVSVSSLLSTIAYSLPDSTVSISGSLDLCPDDSVTLFAPTGPYSYSWSNGDSSSSIVVNQGGQFVLNVIDGNGCVNTSDTIVVVDLPVPQVSSIIGDTVGIVPLQQYTYVVSQVVGQTYSWTAINGAIVSGQGTNIVSVLWNQTNTGTLSVTTTNGYCEDSTSVSIRTNIGVDDFGLTDFSLYPNPTQGKLVIETDFNTDEILIYNAQGRLIQVVSTTGERHQLDISNYSAGVYWIEIENIRKRVVLID